MAAFPSAPIARALEISEEIDRLSTDLAKASPAQETVILLQIEQLLDHLDDIDA